MRISPAAVSDAPRIAQIHVETWRAAYRGQVPDAVLNALNLEWRLKFWQERIAEPQGKVLIAKDKSEVTGFCDLIPTRDRDADPKSVAEIAAIYVAPQHWRNGIGRALCDAAVAEARRQDFSAIMLWVLSSNTAAQDFYLRLGFRPDGAAKTERTIDGSELHEVRFRIEL